MKRILILLFVIISFSAHANEIKIDKNTAIQKATQHIQKACEELYKAETMCWYIPDLNARKFINSLIVSVVASTQVRTPHAALLAVVLPILSQALVDMNDRYCEMRDCFAEAEYHFKMASIYNDFSLNSWPCIDEGTTRFLEGIDHLTRAIVAIETIHPECGTEIRNNILHQLNIYREEFLKDQTNLWKR
jgi:hypothetical protein